MGKALVEAFLKYLAAHGENNAITPEAFQYIRELGIEIPAGLMVREPDPAGDAILACPRYEGTLLLPDNEIGVCGWCDHPIQFISGRPKNIRRCCTPCMLRAMHTGEDLDDLDE